MVDIPPSGAKTPDGARYSDSAGPEVMRRRILLKLSGEAFAGDLGIGLDHDVVGEFAREICEVHARRVEVAVVVGGGNFIRGATTEEIADTAQAHYMGMLGTVINALALQASLEERGVPCRVQSALQMQAVAEPFIRRRAVRHLEKGRVVVFAAGTGNPYFTTDTAAALRATEINADVIVMAKNRVDGVYDADPNVYPDAKKYEALTYDEVIERRLKVMDLTALTHSMQHQMPIVVCDISARGAINRVASGDHVGTLVSTQEAVKAFLAGASRDDTCSRPKNAPR
jgi:uridylate kinase